MSIRNLGFLRVAPSKPFQRGSGRGRNKGTGGRHFDEDGGSLGFMPGQMYTGPDPGSALPHAGNSPVIRYSAFGENGRVDPNAIVANPNFKGLARKAIFTSTAFASARRNALLRASLTIFRSSSCTTARTSHFLP